MVDISVWREGDKDLRQEFYDKPVSSGYVTIKRGVMAIKKQKQYNFNPRGNKETDKYSEECKDSWQN